jgi:methanol corrinoid protein
MKNVNTTKRIPKHDWERFDAMTETQRHAAASADPDAQPVTPDNIGRMKRTPQVKVIRRALRLSQEEFAERFHIPLGTLRDWEQSRKEPDAAARAYLVVIARNAKAVSDALQPQPATMSTPDTYSCIFRRYDLETEKVEAAKTASLDPSLQKVADFVIKGDAQGILAAVKEALAKESPLHIINDGLIAGMNEVSRLWDEGIYPLPRVILASDAVNAGISECEKTMGRSMARKAKVVTDPTEVDIHGIGQGIVNALFGAKGFEVINLGPDVPVDIVVSSAEEHKPTALVTTTMTAFPKIAHKLEAAGINILSFRVCPRSDEQGIRDNP